MNSGDFEKELLKQGSATKALDFMIEVFLSKKAQVNVQGFSEEQVEGASKDFISQIIKWRKKHGDKEAFKLLMINLRVKEMLWRM